MHELLVHGSNPDGVAEEAYHDNCLSNHDEEEYFLALGGVNVLVDVSHS